jgi:hypothetical protein
MNEAYDSAKYSSIVTENLKAHRKQASFTVNRNHKHYFENDFNKKTSKMDHSIDTFNKEDAIEKFAEILKSTTQASEVNIYTVDLQIIYSDFSEMNPYKNMDTFHGILSLMQDPDSWGHETNLDRYSIPNNIRYKRLVSE